MKKMIAIALAMVLGFGSAYAQAVDNSDDDGARDEQTQYVDNSDDDGAVTDPGEEPAASDGGQGGLTQDLPAGQNDTGAAPTDDIIAFLIAFYAAMGWL